MQREAEARFARLKTGAQGPGVKSTASDQSDCPHLLLLRLQGLWLLLCQTKSRNCRNFRGKAFASGWELCRPSGQKYGTLHEFACHPCAGAMLIFSVSFQFLVYVLPKRAPTHLFLTVFLVGSLAFSIYKIMAYMNRGNFTSAFLYYFCRATVTKYYDLSGLFCHSSRG